MKTIFYTYINKYLEGDSNLDSQILKTLDLKDVDSFSVSRVREKKLIFKALTLVLEHAFNESIDQFIVYKNEKGKPWLFNQENKKKYFISYSHSKESIALAVSEDVSFGLDLESVERFKSHKAYKKWLTSSELTCLEESSHSEATACKIWTRKESLTKLSGLGYQLEFKNYSVYPFEEIDFMNESVLFKSLDLGEMFLSFAIKYDKKVELPKLIRLG